MLVVIPNPIRHEPCWHGLPWIFNQMITFMLKKYTIFSTLIIILLLTLNVTANNSPIRSPIQNAFQTPSTSPISPINFSHINEIAQDCELRAQEISRHQHFNRPSREVVRKMQNRFNEHLNNASNNITPRDQEECITKQNNRRLKPELMQTLMERTGDIDTNIQNADLNQLAQIMLESDSKISDIITKMFNQNNTYQNGHTNYKGGEDVHSNIRAKILIETKDQSTSTEDLLLLENSLSDKSIENLEFGNTDSVKDTNLISTTDSEEVAIEDSYINAPTTTSTNALNTEILLEGVDEHKQAGLNNEIHNMNKQVLVIAHQSKAMLDVASASFATHHNLIKNRLMNDGFMPIAAGDEHKQARAGIWASAGDSIAKQGNYYKSRIAVMIIGGDIGLGDSSILGIAYSNAKAHLKFNSLKGNSRINCHILSVYSQHDLQHNCYLQLVSSTASSTIRSKIVGENKKKSHVDNIILESNLIYIHSFSNGIQLLPTIGLKYNYLMGRVDKGQKHEKQTIIVTHKHERILISYFGTKVIFNPIDLSSILQLTPTMHAGLERRMTSDCKIMMASLTTGEGSKGDVRVELPRVVKNTYNLGVGLITQIRNVKLQLDYNYSLQKSYKLHEAVMKLKISM